MQKVNKITWGFFLSVSLVALLSGCTKFLDRKPLQATLSDLNQGGLEGQAIGLYGTIRNSASAPYCGDGMVGIGYIPMQGFRSGDQTVQSDPGAAGYITAYSNFQYSKDDWANGTYWDSHYKMIQICNILLQTADSLKLTDPASLINVAEGKWFRAYSFFDLVKNYGEVPLITNRIYQASDGQIPKSPVAAVYDQIDADLTFAEANLPSAQPSSQVGRLVQNAARTLHAKTYLMRDAPLPTSVTNYQKCLDLCQQIINSKQYELFTPYWAIWKTQNENCSESIFEVQCQQNGNTGAGWSTTYWSWWGTEQGVRGSGDWNLGWGWNNPTPSLANAYEPGDPRRMATILYSDSSDDPANGGYGRTLPPLTNSLYWNKKTYVDPKEQAQAGDPTGAAFVNTRVLRYADVVLMAAECANEIGGTNANGVSNDTLAEAWLEQIRKRARGNTNSLPYVQYVSQSQFRAAIKQERRVEFGMEMERFYDLVRWGDAPSVLGGLGYQAKNEYYPIPSSAIAGNPQLVQNPNY
jgi:starch-binding outer membrane protein, SusD/RagB family